jgi:uncharacterized FlaG/YvyC family protein
MAVNSIPEDVAAFTLQHVKPTVSVDHPTKAAPLSNDQVSHVKTTSNDVAAKANSDVSPVQKQTQDNGQKSSSKPVLMMSDVVVVYNHQGQVRIKFMDSNNNVIYQIPSEVLAKMEDQMMKLETSTTIKG